MITNPRFEKRNKDDQVFFSLNKKTKQGEYRILPKFSQHKYCERVTVEGFDRLPSGFYTNDGIGLTGAGSYLFQELTGGDDSKKVELKIVARGASSLSMRGQTVSAIIPHPDLSKINATVRAIKHARNEETRAHVRRFLTTSFKRQFRHFAQAAPQYASGSLAQTLQHTDLVPASGAAQQRRTDERHPKEQGPGR